MDTPPGACNPITSQDYWEASWKTSDIPDAIDVTGDSPEDRLHRVLHERFVSAFAGRARPGARLLEIGCGGSRWLPYFHRVFGFEVSGIDYSPAGIRLANRILEKAGVAAEVVEGDLFQPPPSMVAGYDVVTSFGVIEHFDSTAQAVAACARFLRPGGLMISTVPTMTGPYGLVYRVMRPDVYRAHVPQRRESLARAHTDAGLDVIECRYLLGLPTMLTRPAIDAPLWQRVGFAVSAVYARLEHRGLAVPPNPLTSPYALCVAVKPNAAAATGAQGTSPGMIANC